MSDRFYTLEKKKSVIKMNNSRKKFGPGSEIMMKVNR